jgi:hypothetical protein
MLVFRFAAAVAAGMGMAPGGVIGAPAVDAGRPHEEQNAPFISAPQVEQ